MNRLICGICMEEFGNEKDVCSLPCGHVKHIECLTEWCKVRQECPDCSTRINSNAAIHKRLYFNRDPNSDHNTHIQVDFVLAANEALIYQLEETKAEADAAQTRVNILEESNSQLREKLKNSEMPNNGPEIDIAKSEFVTDGIGFKAGVTALFLKDTSGSVEIGATLGQLTGGAKLADEHGLDAKVEATATLVEGNVGPVNGSIGLGVDTGLKIGDDGVGLKFLGTGFEIRPNGFGISIFGSKFGINF